MLPTDVRHPEIRGVLGSSVLDCSLFETWHALFRDSLSLSANGLYLNRFRNGEERGKKKVKSHLLNSSPRRPCVISDDVV